MPLKKLPISFVKSYDIEQPLRVVAFVCPSCSSEVDLHEIVEDKGLIRCSYCR
ncbi:MAG: hypothetical protein HYT70_01035 [Candidatus Aenigmarchaeota archaeon]|nr:hypothetical protein [Candidatus Aenigmarchaeota archaeon]